MNKMKQLRDTLRQDLPELDFLQPSLSHPEYQLTIRLLMDEAPFLKCVPTVVEREIQQFSDIRPYGIRHYDEETMVIYSDGSIIQEEPLMTFVQLANSR